MKRIITFILIAFMLSACVATKYEDTYRYNKFLVQYKVNRGSPIGSIAVVYGDRIYYFSDEQENSGIYSMDLNGDNVRFELEARDIQKLQIKDDTLYYLTMDKVIYGEEGAQWGNRYYSLKSIDLKTDEAVRYTNVEEVIRQKGYSNKYRGIWDFYYINSDKFVVSDISLASPEMSFRLKSNIIDVGGSIYNFGEYKRIKLKTPKGEYFDHLAFYDFKDDEYILLLTTGDDSHTDLYTDRFSVYDEKLNSSFTIIDTVISSEAEPRIFYKKGDNYIISSQNYVLEYDAQNEEVVNKYRFDKDVRQIIIFDKNYLLVKFENKEEIYNFDDESFMAEKILTNDKGRIVDIHEDYYILIDNNALYKKNISDEKDIWKIDLGHDYIKREHKVEIAGDWLFIKSFNLEAEQSTLEEKINIATGERIEIEK